MFFPLFGLILNVLSLAPSDPSVVLAAGRAAFRVADLLELSHLIGHIEEGHKEEAEC